MKKPKKGKPRRPRGPRKPKANRKTRKTLRQHILFARRWCRANAVSDDNVREQLEQEPDDQGEWVIDAVTDEEDKLVVDADVRGALLGIIAGSGRL